MLVHPLIHNRADAWIEVIFGFARLLFLILLTWSNKSRSRCFHRLADLLSLYLRFQLATLSIVYKHLIFHSRYHTSFIELMLFLTIYLQLFWLLYCLIWRVSVLMFAETLQSVMLNIALLSVLSRLLEATFGRFRHNWHATAHGLHGICQLSMLDFHTLRSTVWGHGLVSVSRCGWADRTLIKRSLREWLFGVAAWWDEFHAHFLCCWVLFDHILNFEWAHSIFFIFFLRKLLLIVYTLEEGIPQRDTCWCNALSNDKVTSACKFVCIIKLCIAKLREWDQCIVYVGID